MSAKPQMIDVGNGTYVRADQVVAIFPDIEAGTEEWQKYRAALGKIGEIGGWLVLMNGAVTPFWLHAKTLRMRLRRTGVVV